MKTTIVLCVLVASGMASDCVGVRNSDPRWTALDQRYAIIEKATFAKDAKLLFSVYAPAFEAHQFNGQIWKFKESAAYSTAGFERVTENISLSNTILALQDCGHDKLIATVLQQWSRRQNTGGKERLVQTAPVQDETWIRGGDGWLRKLVENERPGAWLVDLKRVEPFKPFDPDAPEYDPHHTKTGQSHGVQERDR